MSLNAAQLLIAFFREDNLARKDEYDFGALWRSIEEIEAHLPLWRQQGRNIEPFETSLGEWKRELLRDLNTDHGVIDALQRDQRIASGDLGVLEWAASLLVNSVPASTPEHRDTVRSIVQEARALLREDDSLPERMRLHILQLLLHVEDVLDRYEVMGDSALEDAVERLFGALRVAESRSEDPSKWRAFWDRWIVPAGVAILGGSPGTVLSITQMLNS